MSGFDLVSEHSEDISALCHKYGVRSLWLFGSAVRDDWNPSESDFDFVVRYGPAPEGVGAFDQFFSFRNELSVILGRQVDLVEVDAVENPFFLRLIERTRKQVFAA